MARKNLHITTIGQNHGLVGRHFKVLAASGALTCRFELLGGGFVEAELEKGLGVRTDEQFKSVQIEAEIEQVITVWAGDAELTDDRNEISLSGANALGSVRVALVAGVAKKALSGVFGRRSVLLKSDVPFCIGGPDVTLANGFETDGIGVDMQGDVWLISETDNEVQILSEVN